MRKSGILIGLAVLCAGAGLALVLPADDPEPVAVRPGEVVPVQATEAVDAMDGRRLVPATE